MSFEAIRLIDLEHFTHEKCAKQMEISRTTVTEIYESARYKIADSLIHGKNSADIRADIIAVPR